MFKRISLCLFIILFFNTYSFSQWIPLDPFSLPGAAPRVQLLSSDDFSSVIKVDLPGYWLHDIEADGKTYKVINIGDEALTQETGLPEIPHIAKVLAIPDRGIVQIEIIEKSSVNILGGIVVAPSRESWLEGKPETPYIENSIFYNSADIYPGELAKAEDPAVYRDFRISRISIFPIRYSPQRKEIEALSSITIKVSYGPGEGINPKTSPQRAIAPSFAKLYRSFIFNYEAVLQNRYGGREDAHDIMLCIMPDNLYNSFQTYAAWKNKTGTQIIMKKFSEIGATANNPVAVRDCILNYYNSPTVPTHVLIVGDYGVAPIKRISYDYTFAYENYFVELEGNDFFPEMMIGRFTNQEDYRLQVMINKFIQYEKNPYLEGEDWFIKSTVCSNNAYASQVEIKRFTAELMRDYGHFNSVDTMMSKSPCIYNLSHVTNAINAGRSYLNYRGEGWTSGWQAHCYNFNTSNVNNLNNGRKLTFVTSIGCGVAMFDATTADNCFGEAWVELGTLTEPRGGIAFVGPTSNTHTTYNNKIDKGIYVGMFQEDMDSPGEALERGRLYLYNVYGNIMWVEYHYRVYCVLGDPSVHIWKNIPRPINVTYPSILPVGFNQMPIQVSASGMPMGKARVCVTGTGIFAYGETDAQGNVNLEFTTTSAIDLQITVTGKSVIPFEGTVNVILGAENVTPNGTPVVTDIDGNLDGKVNPNENCTIEYQLKNWGTVPSYGVYAKLSVPDSITFISFDTDSVVFGTINPNDSISGTPFKFFVKPECPVNYVIPFKLYVASISNSWNYTQNVLVHGCVLEYETFFVDDEGNTLRNFRMDPGETVKLRFKIANKGDDNAPDIIGTLNCSDQYIEIIDAEGSFGSLLPDSSSISQDDYFVVKVSENCPPQSTIPFTLNVNTQNGLYPYSKTFSFNLPVAVPSAPDPTGPGAYGYYAYSSADYLWQHAPQFEWIEIDGIGTQIPKPPGENDFTETVNLPFIFKYGSDHSQVRISSDGWIAFGAGNQTSYLNKVLPVNDTINNMVAVFWDDLFNNSGTSGKLLYYFDEPNHRFIIEWFEVPHLSSADDKETFQIILYDPVFYPTPTGDGEIVFQYKSIVEAGSCTIGIEDHTETAGLLYLFDEVYHATANEIGDNFAIRFTTFTPVVITSVENENSQIITPAAYVLEQNYPNPFNPVTRISYSLPEAGNVNIKIYRIDGELVKTVTDAFHPAGKYSVNWDGKNEYGVQVSSGVYFYRIQANSFTSVKKMLLLK